MKEHLNKYIYNSQRWNMLSRLRVLALLLPAVGGANPPVPPAPPAVVFPASPVVEHEGEAAVPALSRPLRPAGRGATLDVLIEDAENGADEVEDHTSTAYELLQDGSAAQGDYAFHLATHLGHWFKLNPSVAITSGSKLFFQSRLGWATSDQIATVQISTNSGMSWSSAIWTQSGDGGIGETGFSLQEVDLSVYDGETIQVRFLYDFSGGRFFSQATPGVGWYVDNIQIGRTFSKEQYTRFGDPTDDEQLYLEYINRARASATAEALRLRDESDSLVRSAYQSFGVDGDNILNQFAWGVSNGCMAEVAMPLTFNEQLLQVARLHTQDMFENGYQGHVSSTSPPAPLQPGDTLSDRLNRIGYSFGAGENVFAFSRSVAHGHAGFIVDWGNSTNTNSTCYNAEFVGQGMQNPPGHRLATYNPDYREIGIGVINGSNDEVGPQVVTQNFGTGGNRVITGVVFQDADGDSFYDPGEGVAGVRVETPDSAFFSLTSTSGGYAIPVEEDGMHLVTFSGSGVPRHTAEAVVSGGANSKLDYLPSTIVIGGYAVWAENLGVTGGEEGDDDGDGVPNLIEYALAGFDPLVADSVLLPSLVNNAGNRTLRIAKDPSATGVTYGVESSTNLRTWLETGFTVVTDDAATLEVALAEGERRFLRIVVKTP